MQCAAFDTSTIVRIARPSTSSRHVIPKRSASAPTAASNSSRGAGDVTATRMKNRPVPASPNCWDSVIFPPCSASAPDTA